MGISKQKQHFIAIAYPQAIRSFYATLMLVLSLSLPALSLATVYVAGDLAPRGAPDAQLNVADIAILQRFILGDLTPTHQDILIGDVAPLNNPDGVLNVADLAVLMRAVQGAVSLQPIVVTAEAPVLDSAVSPTNDNPYLVTGTATPNIQINLYSGNQKLASATADAINGTFQVSAALLDGVNQLHVTAFDGAFESADSNIINVNYQNAISRTWNSSTISVDTVWTPDKDGTPTPYSITGTLTVTNNATLTLQPGVTLQFGTNAQLQVQPGNTLIVQGTATNKVTFTSSNTSPAAGNWVGIVINSSSASNVINHADIRYAQYGVRFNAGSRGEVHNSTLTQNQYGIFAQGDYYNAPQNPMPIVTHNNIYENTIFNYQGSQFKDANNVVLDASNNWWGSTKHTEIYALIDDYADVNLRTTFPFSPWIDTGGVRNALDGGVTKYLLHAPIMVAATLTADVVYEIAGDVRVRSGANLMIEPGVRIVAVVNSNAMLVIEGTISVQGTADNKVIFTSDQPVNQQAAGDWVGIVINSNSALNVIDHADIRYAQYGVRFNAGSRGEVRNSTISGNQYGIYVRGNYYESGNPVPVVTGNKIYNNTSYNYYATTFYNPSRVALDASNNWWGTRVYSEIQNRIYDNNDSPPYSPWVKTGPFLDETGAIVPNSSFYGPITTYTALESRAYIFDESIRIAPGGYLNVPSGATLQYAPGKGIFVNGGGLIVAGTTENPAVLTSTTPIASGKWAGITIEGSSPVVNINSAVIEYATSGVTFSNSGTSGTVSYTMLRNNGNGIYVKAGASPLISPGNTIASNTYGLYILGNYRVENNPNPIITGNNIYANGTYINQTGRNKGMNYFTGNFGSPATTTLTATGNWWGTADLFEISKMIRDYPDNPGGGSPVVNYTPYLDAAGGNEVQGNYLFGKISDLSQTLTAGVYTITSTLTVPVGEILTLPAGTILNFSPGTGINVNGTLMSQGTAIDPVVFTTTQQTPGSWNGVLFNATSTGSVLNNTVVEWAKTGVDAYGGNVNVSNSTIRNFSVTGVYYRNNATGEIINNTINNNNKTGMGIYLLTSSPTIQGNDIQNTDRGIYIITSSSPIINNGNHITNNNYGIRITSAYTSSSLNPYPVVEGNSIYDNFYNYLAEGYVGGLGSAESMVLTATGNWWGTVDAAEIANKIYDNPDRYMSPVINYGDYLDGPDGNIVSGNYLYSEVSDTLQPLQVDTVYTVISTLVIPSGSIWTIPEGVQLLFTPKAKLIVNGNLVVNGILNNEVLFSSAKSVPAISDWQGIKLNAGAMLSMNYAIVEYAADGLYFDSASGSVSNSLIQFNQNGIHIRGSTDPGLTIGGLVDGIGVGNRIVNNGSYGIYLDGVPYYGLYPQPDIINNDIYANFSGEVGLRDYGTNSTLVLNLSGNYWGVDVPVDGVQIVHISNTPPAGNAFVNYANYKAAPILASVIKNISMSELYISPANNDGVQDITQLTANLSVSSNWQVDVINASAQVIKTTTGTGTVITANWDGRDVGSLMQPDGKYYFRTTLGSSSILGQMRLIVLDNTAPIANIVDTQSGQSLTGIAVYPVTGTAKDSNFSNYRVEYASVSDTPEWTTIEGVKTNEVASDELVSWLLQKLEGDFVATVVGDYELKLTVSDKAGNTTTQILPITIGVLSISNVVQSAKQINPMQGEQVEVNFTLSKPASVTLRILTEDALLPVRQITQTCTVAGQCTILWDGRNDVGQYVIDEAYTFELNAVSATETVTYSTNHISFGVGYTSYSASDATFNVYENDFYAITLFLDSDSRINPAVLLNNGQADYYFSNSAAYTKGNHTLYWDGRDGNGNIATGTFDIWFDKPIKLKQNAIIVKGIKPTITGTAPNIEVKSNPYFITHSYDQYTHFTYRLDQDASVTVKLLPPGINDVNDPSAIVLTPNEVQPAKNPDSSPVDHTVEWTGYDVADPNNIQVSEEGAYTFAIQATSVASGYSTLYRGVIQMRQ